MWGYFIHVIWTEATRANFLWCVNVGLCLWVVVRACETVPHWHEPSSISDLQQHGSCQSVGRHATLSCARCYDNSNRKFTNTDHNLWTFTNIFEHSLTFTNHTKTYRYSLTITTFYENTKHITIRCISITIKKQYQHLRKFALTLIRKCGLIDITHMIYTYLYMVKYTCV